MLTSLTYKAGRIKFDDLRAERSYSGFHRYADSKLAELLAVQEFAERMDRFAFNAVTHVHLLEGHQWHIAVCCSSNKPSPLLMWGRQLQLQGTLFLLCIFCIECLVIVSTCCAMHSISRHVLDSADVLTCP